MRGWLAAAMMVVLTGWLLVRISYPFLAVTERVDATVLAVEGWAKDYAIRAAVEEFKSGGYERVVTTGGPVQGIGGYINDYSTAASIGATRLKAAGIPTEKLHMAPSRVIDRDRTYHSALALRQWLHANGVNVQRINVLTHDVHARRTRLLFQQAFGDEVSIGVIAIRNPDYDAARWWHFSEGVRDVVGESISYLYARFLFFPSGTVPAPAASFPSQ